MLAKWAGRGIMGHEKEGMGNKALGTTHKGRPRGEAKSGGKIGATTKRTKMQEYFNRGWH